MLFVWYAKKNDLGFSCQIANVHGDLLRSYRLPLSVMISGLDDINATDVLDVTYMPPVNGG